MRKLPASLWAVLLLLSIGNFLPSSAMAGAPSLSGKSQGPAVAQELLGTGPDLMVCSQTEGQPYVLAQAKNVKGTLDANLECSGYPRTLCSGGGGPVRALNRSLVTDVPQIRQALLWNSEPVLLPAASVELEGGCTYDRPSRLPYWTVSGIWDDDELLLVDAAANEIIRYSAGRALGKLRGFDPRLMGPLHPSQIASTEGGVVLQLTGGRFVRLGADRLLQTQQLGLGESLGSEGRIDAVRLWAVAGDDLVFCGDTVRGKEDWSLGFFRVPLAELGRFQELAKFDGPDDPAELFCRLGFPYAASIGETAYFLKMEEAPMLYAAVPGKPPRTLDKAELPPRPDLPALVTAHDFPAVYRAIERLRMAAGLFASEGRLYVLLREPRIAGTRWTLHEVDPVTGRELGSAEVPSTANHLLVVPGPRAWAFVEKGEVQEMGVQDVAGFLQVPAENVAAIRSLDEGADLCGRGPRAQGIGAAKR